ncbi:putative sporulation protein [Gottschalkia purinilytica]|uniref:Putative sporulation protein n=1 Tax=Gottschalkia purinilytica TaxID=1503 RepID=A0A0L0WBF3_GOTPU|nr:sporulation membrane protein YtaF [Gottschalkia purinilytica]KNF08675.1 putative sporulation protein [Gottschalkia purinilytica]
MHLLSAILFAVSANLDNLVIGIAYGIKNIELRFKINIIIAILTSIGTFVSMLIGNFARSFIHEDIINLIGCTILIIIGSWFIKDFMKNRKIKNRKRNHNNEKEEKTNVTYIGILREPGCADKDNSGCIDIKESITLGLALSLNNFGLGIGASAAGLSIYITPILTFILSIALLSMGVKLGKRYLAHILGEYATLVSGIIIIFLGIYEMFI